MLINSGRRCARRFLRHVAQVPGLILCLAPAVPAFANTTSAASGGFAMSHAGAVDSGLISVLGTFSSTSMSAAPSLRFPKFDPSTGHLDSVTVAVNTSSSTFAIVPSGVLSLVSFASASRSINYAITAGSTFAADGVTRVDSGGVLLTLLGIGGSEIGGAQVARSTAFTAPADLANFAGTGTVTVDVSAVDTLTVSTLLSLVNGAGFSGSGACAGSVSVIYAWTPYPTNAQLAIRKAASVASARSGDTITYTLVFTNNGASPISTLSIADATPAYTTYQSTATVTLPNGLAVSTVGAPAVGAAGSLTWTFAGQLAAAASGTVQYTVIVN